jgi:hypothetical protein
MNEVGLVNGHKPKMCSVCRGARGSRRDYERTVSQIVLRSRLNIQYNAGILGIVVPARR